MNLRPSTVAKNERTQMLVKQMGVHLPWRVRLYDKFELMSPIGEAVVLPTRKIEGLVAALVVNRKFGVTREELGHILWPKVAIVKRKANLRTALAILKKYVGNDFLDIQGNKCRIREGCEVESDFDGRLPKKGELFMPAVEGDWFEAIRGEVGREVLPDSKALPMDGFFYMLEWLSKNDPGKMISFMRESPAIADGLKGAQLEQLLDNLPEGEGLPGWKDLFVGRFHVGSNIRLANQHFRAAAFVAQKVGDHTLLIHALKELITTSILMNKLGEANAMSNMLSEVPIRRKSQNGAGSNNLARALILLHSGSEKEGFRLLRLAQSESQQYIEATTIQSLRAFFHSTYRQFAQAEALLEVPKQIAKQTGHAYIQGLCGLTEANIVVGMSDDSLDMAAMTRISGDSELLDSPHFIIYIKESIAMRYLRGGNIQLATRTATEVRKLRRAISMAYTPWDEMRLTAKT